MLATASTAGVGALEHDEHNLLGQQLNPLLRDRPAQRVAAQLLSASGDERFWARGEVKDGEG